MTYNIFTDSSSVTLIQGEKYHSFHQISPDAPNIITTYLYNSNTVKIDSFSNSLGKYTVYEALKLLEDNGNNPFVIGTNDSGITNMHMNCFYFDIYNCVFTENNRKLVMKHIDNLNIQPS